LITGLGITQLPKLDYNGCNPYILKTGMDDSQEVIFDIFEEVEAKDIADFIPTLELIQSEDPELFNRVHHYVKDCKGIPILMTQVE